MKCGFIKYARRYNSVIFREPILNFHTNYSMTSTIPTVAIIAYDKDKVLLVKHGGKASHLTGVYGLPGGRINNGETEKEAALREFTEETGLIASENLIEIPKRYTAEIKRKDGSAKTFSMKVYICKSFSGNLKPTQETIPEWIKTDKLKAYNLLPNVEKAVNDGLKPKAAATSI